MLQQTEYFLNTFGCGGTNPDELYLVAQDKKLMDRLNPDGEHKQTAYRKVNEDGKKQMSAHKYACAKFWDARGQDLLLKELKEQEKRNREMGSIEDEDAYDVQQRIKENEERRKKE